MNLEQLETELNEEFEAYTNIFMSIMETQRLVVVDTSFFHRFINKDDNGDLSWQGGQLRSEYEGGLYDWLGSSITPNVIFPSEVVQEYSMGNNRLKKWIKKSHQGLNKKLRGKPKWSKNLMSEFSKQNIRESNRSIMGALQMRRRFLRQTMKRHSVEEYISPEQLAPINRAIQEIAHRPGVIRDFSSRYGNEKRPFQPHEKNGQKKFAKCVALSDTHPVLLATGNSDFIRIREHFTRDRYELASKYDFSIPQHDIDVLFYHQGNRSRIVLSEGVERSLDRYLEQMQKAS